MSSSFRVGWHCNVCTYFHQYPNATCVMCYAPKTIIPDDASVTIIDKPKSNLAGNTPKLKRVVRLSLSSHERQRKCKRVQVIEATASCLIIPLPLGLSQGETNEISASTTHVDATTHVQNTDCSFRPSSQSAYLQHLAEICATILHDERWRGAMSSDAGDDLSAVTALAKFEDHHDADDSDNEIGDTIRSISKSPLLQLAYEQEARAMLLYSRMFVRKGPWFRLDDLLKYYLFNLAPPESLSSSPDNDDPVKALFQDVYFLLSKGFVRSFMSEHECGIVAGNRKAAGGILTGEERNMLLRKLGCGPQKVKKNGGALEGSNAVKIEYRINKVLTQMKSQRPLSFQKSSTIPSRGGVVSPDDCIGETCILLPARRHVEKIIMDSILCKYQALSQTMGNLDDSKISGQDSGQNLPPLCIRLSEQPLQSVRRCARLFLIAGGGSGSMREGGWLTVLECPIKPAGNLDDDDDLTDNKAFSSAPLNWSTVSFPGLQQRLKLKTFFFQNDYKKLRHSSGSAKTFPNTIFHDGVLQFRCWELACELRAHVSYLIESNLHIESLKRREKKRYSSTGSPSKHAMLVTPSSDLDCNVEDSWQVLHSHGKEKLVRGLLQGCDIPDETLGAILCQINRSSNELLSDDKTENKVHDILAAIASVFMHVLRARISFLPPTHIITYLSRPWLRHFQVEAIISYCLWGMVEIFEKSGCYTFAVELLLSITGLSILHNSSSAFQTSNNDDLDSSRQAFVQLLLSRRSRGKALERCVIDCMHILRQEAKAVGDCSTSTLQIKSIVSCDAEADLSDYQKLCFHFLVKVGIGATVPFSSFRSLAKRLKRPLKETVDQISNREANELHLRLESGENLKTNVMSTKKYKNRNKEDNGNSCGWCPITDTCVANSIKSEKGTRCTFVGWEDQIEDCNSSPKHYRSLNVEELALEEYASGRLPNNDPESIEGPRGGWIGWHDEGGHIRALFRILCSDQLLGSKALLAESSLLYLTPYQSSPLDLHVAAQGLPVVDFADGKEDYGAAAKGFYFQRKGVIDIFLGAIELMSQDDLCEIVFETIKKNIQESKSINDPVLMRDVYELRKLSLIAAGVGGKLLSAIFRCLCYDYRHYCGGMPDLILSRAFYSDTTVELVNLTEWVGEAVNFGTKSGSETNSILFDRDDEFLGCSKSDSSALLNNKWGYKGKLVTKENFEADPAINNLLEVVPSKLQLVHNNRRIKVQCMLVEVKSSNDRLDGRQEDWLNLMDKFGYARVCKFESTTANKK